MEFKTTSIAEAWLKASEYVAKTKKWEADTLILRISSPIRVRRTDRAVAHLLNSFLTDHEGLSSHTVAETIFPGYEYKRRGVEGVFTGYPEQLYVALKGHPRRGWGRYAYRLVRRIKPDGTVWNPLENTIAKLKKRHGQRNAFELGIGDDNEEGTDFPIEEGISVPLHDDSVDGSSLRLRPLPCLSHLSFHVLGSDRLHLTALYRSHYYVQRLYGNLLGLARLQDFVASQAGLKVGELVCHSTFARLEHGNSKDGAPWKKKDVAKLLEAARAIYHTSGASIDTNVVTIAL